MRKFLFSFLILLMLTPSLACAMPSCVKGAKTEVSPSQLCPGNHAGTDEAGKVNLLLDCMGVDMQKAQTASIDKPDLKNGFVVYALVTDSLVSPFVQTGTDTIRGPPPSENGTSSSRPLYLTTQRFRI